MALGFTQQAVLVCATGLLISACGGDGTSGNSGNSTGNGNGGGTVTNSGNPIGENGEAQVELRSLSFTDTGNWQYKMLLQTAQDASADINGNYSRYEQYARSTSGSVEQWAFGPAPDQSNELYWNGSEWRQCASGYRTTLTPLTAGNERQFNYCDMYATGSETYVVTDISGQSLASVILDIQGRSGGDGFTDFSNYGPASLNDLGAAVFPADSSRYDVVTSFDQFAVRYANTQDNNVRAYNLDLAAGGTTATNPACDPPITATIDDLSTEATNLEALIASARGTPCSYPQATNSQGEMSLSPHEWWGPSTIEYGELQGVDVRPVGTANYYRPEPSMRVAFDGGAAVSYFECLQRRTDGSIRNCTYLGPGSYSIERLGDARIMTFNNLPADFAPLAVDRVLVERGGRVAPGYREKAGVMDEVGFNETATRALFEQLLIPVPVPQ